jgi:hemerythrin superfamily protein
MSDAKGDSPTVIDQIQQDHREIEALLEEVSDRSGGGREAAFDELARYLAKHEAAEQAVVRPEMNQVDPSEADSREAEEERADRLLERLRSMDADSAEFDELFATFRSAVLRHAEHEESEELPELEANVSPERLVEMGEQFAQAEEDASK